MTTDKRKPCTQATHLGRSPRKFLGAVNTPVFRATTMLFENVSDLERAARGEYPGIGYGLHGLPTVTDLQNAVASIEGGHAALAVPSGLTAATFPFLALAKAGETAACGTGAGWYSPATTSEPAATNIAS